MNADEPRGDDWPAEAWVDGDDHAGDDLDNCDGGHELVWGEGQWAGEHRGQILVPVDHQVEELVEAEQDGRGLSETPCQWSAPWQTMCIRWWSSCLHRWVRG